MYVFIRCCVLAVVALGCSFNANMPELLSLAGVMLGDWQTQHRHAIVVSLTVATIDCELK
jgi:hypothetical protein